ncbi:MAG: O-antigen ligase family protein [Gammaproteobacteria bacterium]|nr:O-antigen ligase family protein [Gammaproteobacteria bacterium]
MGGSLEKLFKVANVSLGAMLVLTIVTYYLAANGKINNFPTYLAAIAFIPFIIIRPDTLFASFSRPIVVLVTVFLLYLVASAAWSDNASPLLVAKYFGYAFLLVSFVLGIAVISSQYPEFLKWLLLVTVLSATISCVYSIFLYFYLPDYQPLIEERLYAMGRLRNPVIAALSYGIAATICANLALLHSRWMRFLWSICFLILLAGILFTETRSVWVGLIVSIPASVILQKDISLKSKAVIVGSFFAIVVITIATTWLAGYWGEVLHRATSFRPEIWMKTLEDTYQVNLFLGNGIASNSELIIGGITFQHAHSIYFSTFFYGGLVGIFLLLVLIGACFRELGKLGFTPIVVLALSTFLFAVSSLFIDGDRLLEKIDFHWLVFWLPVALCLVATSKGSVDDIVL